MPISVKLVSIPILGIGSRYLRAASEAVTLNMLLRFLNGSRWCQNGCVGVATTSAARDEFATNWCVSLAT